MRRWLIIQGPTISALLGIGFMVLAFVSRGEVFFLGGSILFGSGLVAAQSSEHEKLRQP